MALRFDMDVHIPAAITEGLRRRGVNVLTTQEESTREATDETLLRRALELDRILFSQDTDFLRLVHEWQSQQKSFAGIVFAHQQGLSIGQCIADLQLLAECCRPEELSGQIVFLPLA